MGGGSSSDVQEEIRPISNRTLHTPTGSIVPHLLLWAVQVVGLILPRFSGRRTLFSGAILALIFLSQVNPHFTNNIALAQPFTIGWSVYLSVLEKVLFSEQPGPEASFWHLDKRTREALFFPAFGLKKLRWALVVMFNLRGVRWNFEVKNIPKSKITTRSWFLIYQTLNLIYYILMADLMGQLGIRLFYTAPDGQVGSVNSKYLSLRHPDWRWSFVKTLVFGATPYYICSMQYAMFSIPAVLLNTSKPEVRNPISRTESN